MMLRLGGHDVQTAALGEEAIELARLHRSDLILLDIGLPEMDGYEVARRIRREPWGRDLLLVAITGWGQEKDKLQAADAGFDTHLTKPIDPETLDRLVYEGSAAVAP